jgi:iron(III) transport system substrate-binding protein
MIRQRTAARAVAVVLAASLLLPDPGAARAEEINLYSTREAPLVEPVIAAFTAATAAWLHGLRTNLAQPPDGKDNDVIRNIAQGACAIGIANTVALAQLRDGREGREWTGYANQVKAVPTAFGNGGAHVNITGAALAKHAPHRDAAVKFLEYLVTPAAQKLYAAAELEYPVAADAEAAPLVTAIGSFAADTLPLDEIAAHQKAAVALIRQAGFEK